MAMYDIVCGAKNCLAEEFSCSIGSHDAIVCLSW